MITGRLEDLVLVRHGESEGDVRRAAVKMGQRYPLTKDTLYEEETSRGARQSAASGSWIESNIVPELGQSSFELSAQSPLLRAAQSAGSLGLQQAMWQQEPLLTERNRGLIRGLTKAEHKKLYPGSFNAMLEDPLLWTPPAGESIKDVCYRAEEFLAKIALSRSAILVTHRDWMWAAQAILEDLTDEQLMAVNTDQLENGHVVHYTNRNPYTGERGDGLRWKRTVCPWKDNSIAAWQEIELPAVISF